MVIVVFATYVLLGPLVVPRDAVETARNIVAHPTQFRIAMTGFLFYSLNSIVLLAALYIVFRPINQGLALLWSLFRLVFANASPFSCFNLLSGLRRAHGGGYLHALEHARLQFWARASSAGTFDDYYVGLPFFGLAATVWAWLWLKSGYLPRTL